MSNTAPVMVEACANELLEIVERTTLLLRNVSDDRAAAKPDPTRWSIKEVVGHLVDSAANNHQRFVRAQEVSELISPSYEQDFWVARQKYADSAWSELIEFWRLYNRHLARVIRHVPTEKLDVICRIGPHAPVTLGFLIQDYLVHLKHHLSELPIGGEVR